jgi:hypothetical protein
MRIVQSPYNRNRRVRNAILLGVTVAAGLGLGYALSYDIDEEAHYQRSIAKQNARVREQAMREREARLAQGSR